MNSDGVRNYCGAQGRSLLYETPAVCRLTGLGESIHSVSVLDSVAGSPSVIGSRATTTIPLAPDRQLTSRLPPSWRSLSRIPLRPTPGLFDKLIWNSFSAGIPLPSSLISIRTSSQDLVTRISATELPE